MKPKAFISCPDMILAEVFLQLEKLLDLVWGGCNLGQQAVLNNLRDALIWIVGGNEKITVELLKKSKIRFIVYIGEQLSTAYGPGAEEFCKTNRICVLTTGGGREAVALSVIEEMLAHKRRQQSRIMRSFKSPPGARKILQSDKIVVVGAGGIGSLILKLLRDKCGCTNLWYAGGRGSKPELEKEGYRYISSLLDAFRADIVSVHLTYIPGVTEKIIGLDELSNLRRYGLFLNYARAWLVNPDGLLKFLLKRRDARAIFDPFYVEGAELGSLRNMHDPLSEILRAILRRKLNFESRGHTAIYRDEAYLQYGISLLQILSQILQELR
ncbi:MAG: NAD(P)-dependent oxidoreductase [Parcubacteria group bacterium]|jgi:phosphoglycerate dehydrogenase-like enzyme